MTDEKIIEEMLKLMCGEYGKMCGECPCTDCANELHAKRLYEQNYRKIPEGAVVLTVEEIERLKKSITDFDTTFIKHFEETIRKETAREIADWLDNEKGYCGLGYLIKRQFGVEEQSMNGMELKELLDTVSEKVRKETAREILKAVLEEVGEFYGGDIVDEIAKQYNVEVE